MTQAIDYALSYAAINWPVFPLKPGTKEPRTQRGFHDATTDPDVIRSWWTKTPDAGVGIHPCPGGLAVLDIDTKKGGTGPEQLDALQDEYGQLPPTLTARTPSGALHMVFRCTEPLTNCKLSKDIDIRCANGYIAAEPTMLADGSAYSWLDWDVTTGEVPEIAELPQWVIDLSQAAAERANKPKMPAVAALTLDADPDEVQAKFADFLKRNKKARARWEGSTEGLQDTSGSARDASMMALLKIGKFSFVEAVMLLQDWEHGSEQGRSQGDRYWERTWANTSEPVESDCPYTSDIGLAETFARENKDRFRWTPGLDWMRNRGTHWVRDDVLGRYGLAKQICKEVAGNLGDDKVKVKITSASTVNAVVSLARSEPTISTPIDEWDKYPLLLNTKGGVFDLQTGREVPRDGLLFTQVAGAAPDATMPIPTWTRFISQVFGDDLEMVEFIQRMAGYCLTGDTREQKLFFLHGTGSNGKSVFIDALHNLLGTYSHNLPSEALMRQQHEGHPTQYASLFGKRLAISSEIEENAYWAESRIKSLTGDEKLTARYMRQDFFEFKITHKHVIAGNFKPRLKGDDYAMVRRLVLIPFEQTFKGAQRDPKLPEKLRAEYPGILAWMIEGAAKWAADGLRIPQRISDASASYMDENDDIKLWADECCEVGPGYSTPAREVYASFKAWKEAGGERAPSEKAFSQRVELRFTKRKTKAYNVFDGIAIRQTVGEFASYANRRG